jgi:hypothetical protein
MGLFILRFWPALIPLIVYVTWLYVVRRKAEKAGTPKPQFRDGPWYSTVIASLLIAAACLVYWGITQDSEKGAYTPPQLKDGELVPGKIEK